MKTRYLGRSLLAGALALFVVGCAAPKKPDYTNFRAHRPRSILVLPPINQSTAVEGTYGYLSTATMPIAEMGYYVFPVVIVDQLLKENGLPTPGEMHQAPLNKISEIIGADAVLYVTLMEYGTKYMVLNSATTVTVTGKLVDTKTGITIWEGAGVGQENSNGSGNLIADAISALVTQVVNSSTDEAHDVSRMANANLLTVKGYGLLYGPYSPKYQSEEAKNP